MDNVKKVKKLVDFQGKHYGYKIVHNDVIQDDGTTSNLVTSCPMDEENTDYQNILKWVAEGNVIEEAD
jgi:hypothetical protein